MFKIEDGVLTFKRAPNFEMTDTGQHVLGDCAGDRRDQQDRDEKVMVEVTNVEEPGKVTLSALRPQSATRFTATLTDPDGPTGPITTGVTWQWAKAGSKTGACRH